MVHDTKAWRTSSEKFEKEAGKEKTRGDDLVEKLEAKEKELEEAFSRIVRLEESKDNSIYEYLESDEYMKILAAHDDSFYLVPYSHGWGGALKAVDSRHPSLFSFDDFPYLDSRHPSLFSFDDFPYLENPQLPSHQPIGVLPGRILRMRGF